MIAPSLAPNLINMQIAISHAMDEYPKYKDKCARSDYMVVINMREPSYRMRMAVVDLTTGLIQAFHHTSHGSGSSDHSNPAKAVRFSNINDSHMSSLGAMVTAETYTGKHGYSLRLDGLEKGKNDQIRRRAMVVHEADNMTDAYIMANNRCGQSWGCSMVSPAIKNALIATIKGGCFFYVYF